jgi:hypothetical protein
MDGVGIVADLTIALSGAHARSPMEIATATSNYKPGRLLLLMAVENQHVTIAKDKKTTTKKTTKERKTIAVTSRLFL